MIRFRNTQFLVTKDGRVFSEVTNKFLKPATDGSGYLRCAFKYNGKHTTFKVHRLVAECYIPNPLNKPQVNHIDGDKKNNTVENLEWCTHQENITHAIETGLFDPKDKPREKCINKTIKKGELNGCSKLTEKEVLEIREKFKPRVYTREMLALEYNVKASTIKDVILRKSWKHI